MNESGGREGNETTINQGSDLRTLQAIKGETFVVHLWEDRTRGELWVPTYNSAAIVLVDDEFLRTTSNNAVDSGRRTFAFQAVAPGEHRLEFNKRMAWKFTAENRRVFLVHVEDPSNES